MADDRIGVQILKQEYLYYHSVLGPGEDAWYSLAIGELEDIEERDPTGSIQGVDCSDLASVLSRMLKLRVSISARGRDDMVNIAKAANTTPASPGFIGFTPGTTLPQNSDQGQTRPKGRFSRMILGPQK